MKEDSAFYKELLDNLSEGVYYVDRDRKILYWNHGAERISGYTAAEVQGSHCFDNILMHVDDQGHSLCQGACPLVRAIRDDREVETEAYLRHKDGHRVPVLIRTVPIRGPGGRPEGAVELFSENRVRQEMTERIRQLEAMSLVDPLTGLANRRYLDMTLRSRFDQVRRYEWKFGILFVDIDHFKAVNDSFGHEQGDRVLAMVAHTMQESSRSFDVVGRWGGEEFLVVCDQVDGPRLRQIAERYRVLIESSAIPVEKGVLRVTVSIGGAIVQPGDTIRQFVTRADRLMYESKKGGRNRVTVEGA